MTAEAEWRRKQAAEKKKANAAWSDKVTKKEEKERNHMEAVQREQEDRRRVREAFKVCSLPECMYNNISP